MKRALKFSLYIFIFFILLLAAGIAYVAINQEKLLAQLSATLKKNIRGELSIQKLELNVMRNFPHLSLQLDGVSVKDSLYKKEVFGAEKVFFSLNVIKLLMLKADVQSISVLNGNFFLQKDSSGYFNAEIFKLKDEESSSPTDINFELKKLKIENLQVIFNDEIQDQRISVNARNITGNVEKIDSVFHIFLEGLVHTDSMIFKSDKGAFLVNKDATLEANLIFDMPDLMLKILPTPVYVDEEKYNMQGQFDFSRKPVYFTLGITNPAVKFEKARSILSSVILEYMEGIEVPDPVDVNILIKGEIIPNFPPEVDANFKLRNARVNAQGVSLSNVNLDGLFMNYVKPGVKNDDYNSALHFHIPSAKVEGIPFKASVHVIDLKALRLDLSASANTPLTSVNQALPGAYQFTAGNAKLDLSYKGTLFYYLDSINRNFDDTLEGNIRVTDGAFAYFARNLELKNINANIDLNESQFTINDISGELNGSPIRLIGIINSVRRIFSKEVSKMDGAFSLTAPRFDLTKMLVAKKVNAAPATQPSPAEMKKVAATIDQITSELSVLLLFQSDLFTFRKLSATKVKGEFTLSARGMHLKNFTLNTCKGNIAINGELNTAGKYDKLDASLKMKNLDVQKFLADAENFNQEAITASNLNGNLSADVHFASALDPSYTPIPDSMQAHMYFSLKAGKLMQFEPLGQVSKYIFKKRDFSNISFAEVKDSVLLRGTRISFKRMEVASSVIRVFVQGNYAFNGISDITVQFPLSNFKKQELNYEPVNMGTDAKAGSSIFVRLRGANNKMKISLDAGALKRLKKESAL